jgi:hypothetical protein
MGSNLLQEDFGDLYIQFSVQKPSAREDTYLISDLILHLEYSSFTSRSLIQLLVNGSPNIGHG